MIENTLEQTQKLQKVESYITNLLFTRLDPKLKFHNSPHTLDPKYGVVAVADNLCTLEKVDDDKRLIIVTAAYFHDTGYLYKKFKNEPLGAMLARNVLPIFNYVDKEIEEISNLILATDISVNPKNHLEQIIKDADLDHLGREDFYKKNEDLRIELGIKNIEAWHKSTLHFMESHVYYTQSQRQLRDAKKQENKEKLKKFIKEYSQY